jgi:uncharacterized membrane protein
MGFISRLRRYTKRPAVHRSKAGNRARQMWPVWLICGALVSVVAVGLIFVFQEDRSHRDDTSEIKLPASEDLRIPLDRLVARQLYLFRYPGTQGRSVRFVVQHTPDGVIHTNIAACQACNRSEHQHFTRKGEVICGMCNQPMHRPDENNLTPEQRQCTLVYLPHFIHNDAVVVSAKSILDVSEAMETP